MDENQHAHVVEGDRLVADTFHKLSRCSNEELASAADDAFDTGQRHLY